MRAVTTIKLINEIKQKDANKLRELLQDKEFVKHFKKRQIEYLERTGLNADHVEINVYYEEDN